MRFKRPGLPGSLLDYRSGVEKPSRMHRIAIHTVLASPVLALLILKESSWHLSRLIVSIFGHWSEVGEFNHQVQLSQSRLFDIFGICVSAFLVCLLLFTLALISSDSFRESLGRLAPYWPFFLVANWAFMLLEYFASALF